MSKIIYVMKLIVIPFLLIIFFNHYLYSQGIPNDFSQKVINGNKMWRAVSHEKVQVSGSSIPTDKGSIIFKNENILEIVDQNGKKLVLTYIISPGVVDPILKTNDKKTYEIRFFNKPPIEVMRLRCIESPSKIHYLEDTTYMR